MSASTDNKPAQAYKRSTKLSEHEALFGLSDATEQTVRSVRFVDILRAVSAPHVMHYLSLDVEGAEDEALPAAFPIKDDHGYLFLTATIERPSEALHRRMLDWGYVSWAGGVQVHGCTASPPVEPPLPHLHRLEC